MSERAAAARAARTPRAASGPTSRALAAALVLCGLLAAAPLAAQQGDAPAAAQTGAGALQLTLDEALRIAGARNPAYRQAINSSGLNGVEWRTTLFDQVLPRVTLDLFQTSYYGNIRRRAQDNFGNPIANPTAEWVYFSETSQGLGLSWSIQGSSIFDAIAGQRLTNRSRTLAESRALTELEIAVQRDFFDVQEQRELLAAEQELLAARELDHEASERLFRLALQTRVDVLRAELEIERQRLTLRQQEATLRKAELALRTRLGGDELAAFELVEAPLPIFDPSGLEADVLVGRAADVNPGLEEARVTVESARVDLRRSNNAWWPNLFLNYNLSRRAQTSEREALFDVSWDEDLDHRFYVGLELPMFNGFFQNRQEQARASVELENQTEAEREARLAVEEAVRSALLELQNQWETLRVTERAGEIAGRALELVREEYRLGSRTFEELRRSVEDEAETRRQLIQARYAFVDALLALEEAVGARVRS